MFLLMKIIMQIIRTNNKSARTKLFFEYKAKLIGSTSNNNSWLNAEVVVPLKHLGTVWRFLNLSLINCEIELDLTWSKNRVISEISRTPEVDKANPVDETLTTGAIFQINNTKLYVPVVTLSINDKTKFLEHVKQEYKRTICWDK